MSIHLRDSIYSVLESRERWENTFNNRHFPVCVYDDAIELEKTRRLGATRIAEKTIASIAYGCDWTYKPARLLLDMLSMCLPATTYNSTYSWERVIIARSYMFDEIDNSDVIPTYTWWYGSHNGALLCAVL